MNKYFIGYPVPEDLGKIIAGVQHYTEGVGELIALEQLHVTAYFLGERTREFAEGIFQGLSRRNLPVICSLDTYQRFGRKKEALVITLQANSILQEIHVELNKLMGTSVHKDGYVPHITIAKGEKMFIKLGCPEKNFTLGCIALYEKQSGGEYHIHMTKAFR